MGLSFDEFDIEGKGEEEEGRMSMRPLFLPCVTRVLLKSGLYTLRRNRALRDTILYFGEG